MEQSGYAATSNVGRHFTIGLRAADFRYVCERWSHFHAVNKPALLAISRYVGKAVRRQALSLSLSQLCNQNYRRPVLFMSSATAESTGYSDTERYASSLTWFMFVILNFPLSIE